MSGEGQSDERNRIERLKQVNTELAAEIRALRSGRTSQPRSSSVPAARRLSQLLSERDSLAHELNVSTAELRTLRGERESLLGQQNELLREVARLRGGLRGLLRRARARLLRT